MIPEYLNVEMLDNLNDDCVFSRLTMSNYSWDSYWLKEYIELKDGNTLVTEATYFLANFSDYRITLIKPDGTYERMEFKSDSELAINTITNRMKKNIKYINVREFCFDIRKMACKTYNDFYALSRRCEVTKTSGTNIGEE